MGFQESITFPLTTRERLAQVLPAVMDHIEIVPGTSLPEWSHQCGNAVDGRPRVPSDHLECLRSSVRAIEGSLRRITEHLLVRPNEKIPPEIETALGHEILQCAVSIEMLRPSMGEDWPLAPGCGTNGHISLAEQMIEQARTEVKQYYATANIRQYLR